MCDSRTVCSKKGGTKRSNSQSVSVFAQRKPRDDLEIPDLLSQHLFCESFVMDAPSADPISRFVQACNPSEALEPTDPRYVDFDQARGGNVVDRIVRAFRRANKPDCKLFAGHRGIGKTSELKRLQSILEQAGGGAPPFLVVFVDATRQLDSNDLDFPDLLVLLAGELQKQLRSAAVTGFSGTTTYLKRLWDDLVGLLGKEIRIESADVELPFGSLALEFRNRPTQRMRLRENVESMATDLLHAVNQLLDEANAALRASGRAGLVLIVNGRPWYEVNPVLRTLERFQSRTVT
jgi:hypothetical protein